MQDNQDYGFAVCPICGKKFKKRRWNQKYCSQECLYKAHLKRCKQKEYYPYLSFFDLELLFEKQVKHGKFPIEKFEHQLDRSKRYYSRRGSKNSLATLLNLEKRYLKWKEGKNNEKVA